MKKENNIIIEKEIERNKKLLDKIPNCSQRIDIIKNCYNKSVGKYLVKWYNIDGELVFSEELELCQLHLNFFKQDSMIRIEKV